MRRLGCGALAFTQFVATAACTPNDNDSDTPANNSGGGGTLSTASGGGNGGSNGTAVDGEPCTGQGECSSGFCADGLCCNESCDAACASCALAASPGACSPIPSGEDPDDECSNGACDGAMTCGMTATWSKVIGINGPDNLNAGTVDGLGNILITGNHQAPDLIFDIDPLEDSGYIVKLDGDGDHVWSRGIGGTPANPDAVAADSAGNVAVGGYFIGTLNLGGPFVSETGHDGFVIKLDSAGTVQWARHFAGASFQGVNGVAFDSGGNVIITGVTGGTVDFGGGPIGPTGGGTHAFVAKLDPDGGYLWAVGFGDAEGMATAVAPSGDVIVLFETSAGASLGGGVLPNAGERDVALARLDGNTGAHVWSGSWGNAGQDLADALAVDGAGNIAITGTYRDGTLDLGGGDLPQVTDSTAFIAQFDQDGDHLWSRGLAGATGRVFAYALAFSSSGTLVVAGSFTGVADLGKATYGSDVQTNPFLFFFDGSGGYAGGDEFGIDGGTATRFVGVDPQAAVITSCRMGTTVDFGNGPLSTPATGIAVAKFAP